MNEGERKCPITDLLGKSWNTTTYGYSYTIIFEGKNIRIEIPDGFSRWLQENCLEDKKHIIAGLLLNGKLLNRDTTNPNRLYIDSINKALSEGNYPKTPQEKYENLFLYYYNLQDYDGQLIDMQGKIQDTYLFKKLYFKTEQEMIFYTKSLLEAGLIGGRFSEVTSRDGDESIIDSVQITYKGLAYALKLLDEGVQSKNCFIAMSFGNDMKEIRSAIKEACRKTGFVPVLVDEIHYESDTTINDAIIANLRKSRFCIADFTEQKDGVYFESGFCLGQGKQVIYSCQDSWFNKSHFDTNHFPHIVYKTPNELTKSLINKIEAWIL